MDAGSLDAKKRRYVVFDVETTGLTLRNNRIIEIGAVEINGGLLGKEFHSLIDIRKPVPKAALKIHGITTSMLTGQPGVEEVMTTFLQFIRGSILVAHNAEFDMSFLRSECTRLGLSVNNRCLCTLNLSQRLYPWLPDYRLETVAKHILGIEIDKTKLHRALYDTRLTAQIWQKIRMQYEG